MNKQCPGCKMAIYDDAAIAGWCTDCEPETTRYHDGQRVRVFFGGEWTEARVTGVRDHDYSIPPHHVRVHIPGPARGTYSLTLNRVMPA